MKTAIPQEIVIEILDDFLQGLRRTNQKNLHGEKFYYTYARCLGAISILIELLSFTEGKRKSGATWRTIIRLDRRFPSLRLARTIDTTIRNAIKHRTPILATE